ncbi:YbgC/FadM family acyl-CoA thioesterase [Xenorhabdus stockiae]|uniref:YbgC/FadM family acyl-CoA thioesterase n=1 Tax=Xenorhabdus stockiae TaxID=351614 RepID=UPI004062FD93
MSFNLRVYYSDTDAEGVVYHGAYVNFYDRARTEFFRSLGIESGNLADRNCVFAVRKIGLEYLSPSFLDDLLHIKTVITGMGKTRLRIEQSISNSRGEVINQCEVVLFFVDLQKKKITAIPSDIFDRLIQSEKKVIN